MSDIEKVIEKISELIPQAPSNWAEIIGQKLNRSESSVREYARGIKGIRNGKTLEVLELLIKIIAERKEKINKLIA